MFRHLKLSIKTLLRFSIVLMALLLFCLSPVFGVKNITVVGNEAISFDEFCRIAGISEGQNIFSINTKQCTNNLYEVSYIQSVEIKKVFPNSINVQVQERKVRGYVPYTGAYLYIDEEGRVLDSREYFKDDLPVINGLKFETFSHGEKLEVENAESLNVVLTMSRLMVKYDLLDLYFEVDVTDPDDIKLKVNEVIVYFGDLSDADLKLRLVSAALPEISDYRGTIDVRDVDNIFFTHLT